jgi:hypothetical protein
MGLLPGNAIGRVKDVLVTHRICGLIVPEVCQLCPEIGRRTKNRNEHSRT